jgi:hypothetical protein
MIRIGTVFAMFAALAACAPARAQIDPATLPAHDAHQNLLIGVQPWLDAARYKDEFGKKNPYVFGIVALDVYFRNDNDYPIHLDLSTIRLVVNPGDEDAQHVEPLSPEDVADAVLLTSNTGSTGRPQLPSLIPKGGHDKDWTKLDDELRADSLSVDIVPPHGTVHGCIYFNVNHRFDFLRRSSLYIPDLSFMVSDQVLLFFEINLAPAAAKP